MTHSKAAQRRRLIEAIASADSIAAHGHPVTFEPPRWALISEEFKRMHRQLRSARRAKVDVSWAS